MWKFSYHAAPSDATNSSMSPTPKWVDTLHLQENFSLRITGSDWNCTRTYSQHPTQYQVLPPLQAMSPGSRDVALRFIFQTVRAPTQQGGGDPVKFLSNRVGLSPALACRIGTNCLQTTGPPGMGERIRAAGTAAKSQRCHGYSSWNAKSSRATWWKTTTMPTSFHFADCLWWWRRLDSFSPAMARWYIGRHPYRSRSSESWWCESHCVTMAHASAGGEFISVRSLAGGKPDMPAWLRCCWRLHKKLLTDKTDLLTGWNCWHNLPTKSEFAYGKQIKFAL